MGYCNFPWYKSLDDKGIIFVTRIKKNAVYSVIEQRDVSKFKYILSDQTIKMVGYQTKDKCTNLLRRIRSKDPDTGKCINILTNNFDFSEVKMLDLFGGTGSHSYEFISRGCTDVTYVDKFFPCIQFVQKTAETLKIQSDIRIFRSDVFKFMETNGEDYDYIFAGPPYALTTMDTIPDLIFAHKLLRPQGWFVMEHNPNHNYTKHPFYFQERHYGKTIFSFFQLPPDDAENTVSSSEV
jgi:16S rRNA G966 N2-methylase RsmD